MPQNISPEKAHLRAKISALTRAVRAGERPANDPVLEETRRNLAHVRTAEYAAQLVANWPALTEQQIDHVAGILRAGAP